MKSSVREFVRACSVCQQAKLDRAHYPGLLQPLPVPAGAWEMVSLDFVEGLPRSGSANCILVVVDKFSKFAHFIPLKHPFTALMVAKVYMDNVYRLHGMPSSLISDCDRIFTSTFWHELFSLAGVQLRMSSAYHRQTDGQTERVNQCMRVLPNGLPGYLLRSSGTTQASIQHWVSHHSRLSTAMHLATLG